MTDKVSILCTCVVLCWCVAACSGERGSPVAHDSVYHGAAAGDDPEVGRGVEAIRGAGAGAGASAAHGGNDVAASAPVVQLRSGAVEGTVQGATRVFLGIAYATPPLGALRFAPAEPAAPWSGVRTATAVGPVCPQQPESASMLAALGRPPFAQSEDCLQLNVYAPASPAARGRPVMVFVHGGSGMAGSGGELDGRYLSEQGDVVVVTINYRLGVLAGITLPELDAELGHPSGNLALRDQQLALRWVQDNAAAFGGDPGAVTLFGQSAGAAFGCMHLFAKGSEGLFARLILQSGTCVSGATSRVIVGRQAVVDVSRQIAKELCPAGDDPVACLRALDADKLARWVQTAPNPPTEPSAVLPIYVDGDLLADFPDALLRQGRVRALPLVLGTTADEFSFLASGYFGGTWPLVTDWTALLAFELLYPGILQVYGTSLLELPGLGPNEVNAIAVRFINDAGFRCPARSLARKLSAQGDAVYLYSFEQAPAVHTLDLDYVFGLPGGYYSRLFEGAPAPPAAQLVEAVQAYWTSFARSGVPMGPSPWPAYTERTDAHLALAVPLANSSGLASAACAVLDRGPAIQ